MHPLKPIYIFTGYLWTFDIKENNLGGYDAALKIWFNQSIMSYMRVPNTVGYIIILTFIKGNKNPRDAESRSKLAHLWKGWNLNPVILTLILCLASIPSLTDKGNCGHRLFNDISHLCALPHFGLMDNWYCIKLLYKVTLNGLLCSGPGLAWILFY